MKKTIMVADDDAAIVDSLQMMLEFSGYEVITTVDGEVARTMKKLPDLLLLDIWMSGESGGDICAHLKSQKRTKNLPIIMISASRDVEKTALKAGADDFLAKPFEMDALLKKIKKHIR